MNDDNTKSNEKGLRRMFPSMAEGEVPRLPESDDEDMRSIRSWTTYPAEVNKAIPASMFDEFIDTEIEVDGELVKVTKDYALQSVAQLRAVVGDLGLNRKEADDLMNAIRGARPSADVDEEAVIPKREEIVDALNREHGKKASKAFKAARAYISKNPFLGAILDKSGLGDEPKVVTVLASKALALHESGKLRIK